MSDRRCKLTEQQVLQIRSQYQQGRRPKFIIKEFGISYSNLWAIINERTWKKINNI